jgi:hypothetical protein
MRQGYHRHTVTVMEYLFKQHPIKESEQQIPSIFRPASGRGPEKRALVSEAHEASDLNLKASIHPCLSFGDQMFDHKKMGLVVTVTVTGYLC